MSITIDEAFASLYESPLNEALTAEQKMDAWHAGTRRDNIGAASEEHLRAYYNICLRKGYDAEAEQILKVARRKGYLRDITDEIDAQEPAIQQLEINTQETPAEEPARETPATEEPTQETPTVEEPVQEEPAPEALATAPEAPRIETDAAMQRILDKFFTFSTVWITRNNNSDIWYQPLSGNKTRDVSAIRKKVDPGNPKFVYIIKTVGPGDVVTYSLDAYAALNAPADKRVVIGKTLNNEKTKVALTNALLGAHVGNNTFVNNIIRDIFSWNLWDGSMDAWYAPLNIEQKSPEEIAARQAVVDRNKQKNKE